MKGAEENHLLTFRPDIEGLRAVAILLVVAAHAGVPWLAGGFIGVDVFFVLSGFLITGKLVQEAASTGRIRLLPFYVRRLRRLLPALLLMLLVVGLASTWLLSPLEQSEQLFTAQMAALWLSNVHFALGNFDYFAAGSETNLYLHTWSLGVEEQFYLVWPALVLWLLARDGARGVARLRIGMWAVLLASLLACIALTRTAPFLAFYMMPLRAWQFAAGALVWLLFARMPPASPRLSRAAPGLGLLGLALIVACGLQLDAGRAYPGAWALLPTLGTALVVMAGCLPRGQRGVGVLLSLPPLQWLGRISYSWYLWHWPVLLLGVAYSGNHAPEYRTLLVALSLALGVASHALVEAPLRRWRQWLALPRTAVLVSLSSMAAMGALATHWTRQASDALQTPALQRYAAARADAPAIYAMGCDDWYRSAAVRVCSFGSPQTTRTAVLMGDSHIGQWFPAVHRVLDGAGWRLLVITKSACPMVDAPIFYARIGREYTECAQWRDAALQTVQELKPDLFIFGSAPAAFTTRQWTEGTARVLARLSPAVARIVLLADTPALPFDGPQCPMQQALRPAWLADARRCTSEPENSDAATIRRLLQATASRFTNVEFVDMGPHVCPDGVCRAELDGRVTYRDNQHLSGSFAESLAPAMGQALRAGGPQ